jgi:hypothetical protein
MMFGEWISQNWFDLFSGAGIIGGLWFTAVSLHSETKTRRIANLLILTQNHQRLWQDFYQRPQLARVLDSSADIAAKPVTLAEQAFVNMAIQHLSAAYYSMQSDLTIKPEGVRRDVAEFFSLPVPNAVWQRTKPLQNQDFAAFVESALK